MRSNDYWKTRMEVLENAQNNKSLRYYKDLEDQYKRATIEIQRDVARWYQRLANNNEMGIQEAKKLLDADELAEFKWTVNEYIKYGKENAIDQRWMKELENASAKVHISRLESIQLQLRQKVEVLYNGRESDISDFLSDVYQENYGKTGFEIQRGLRAGWDVDGIDEKALDRILSKPWTLDGKTFSDRIWTNKAKLVTELQTELFQSFARGRSPDEAIKNISERLNIDRSKAGRLVMTESAAMHSASQREMLQNLGVEKYEYMATLDNKTSKICQDMDGRVFRMEDYQIGVTAHPLHPNCRSITIPYFDDFTEDEKRIARGADGKTYFVPASMKYKEWKESFLGGGPKDALTAVAVDQVIKTFKPAATPEEAQEYAKNFAEKVDYGKMSLDHMNEINRTLTEIYSDKLPKMKLIEMKPGSYKGFKSGAMASYNFVYNEMYLNSAVLKNSKALNKFVKKMKDSEDLIRSIKLEDLSKYTAKQSAFISKHRRIGRQLVEGDTIKGIVTHEFGHHVDFSYLDKRFDKNEYLKGFIEKGEKISVYASEQPREYMAESFVAYIKGERERLSEDVLAMFDELYDIGGEGL